jgi:hypothetical protein
LWRLQSMCSGACVFVVLKLCPWVWSTVSTYLVMAYLVALLTCVPPTMVDFSTVSSQNHVSYTRSPSKRWQNDSISLGLTNLDLPKELLLAESLASRPLSED